MIDNFKVSKLAILIVILGVLLSSGCTQDVKKAEVSHDHEVGEDEISPSELNRRLTSGQDIIVIDVRDQNSFKQGHIPDALNIPLEKISLDSTRDLDNTEQTLVVVYHKSSRGGGDAKSILGALGFENVRVLSAGITHWAEDGFKVEGGTQDGLKGGSPDDIVPGGPRISFDRLSHSFGQIPQYGGNVSTGFTVINTGNETLEIGTIMTSCGCTSAEMSTKNIEPAEKAILTVYFNPNLHEEPPDEFSRTVFIESNDPSTPEAEVKITVDIMEGM